MQEVARTAERLHSETKSLSSVLGDIERRVIDLERQYGLEQAAPPAGKQEKALSKPLLDKQADQSRVVQAAWEFENAVFNQLPEKYPIDVCAARKQHVELLRANRWYNLGLIGLVLLTYLEVPAWCHGSGESHGMFEWVEGSAWCQVPSHGKGKSNANLSGVQYLPPGFALILEVIIEAVVLWKFYLEYKLQDEHFMPVDVVYHSSITTKLGCLFAVGNLLDTATFILVRQPFRLTFLFRSGLIFLTPWVQHIFFNIFNMRVIGEFTSVGVFFLGTIFIFAWIGLTLFKDADTFSYKEGEKKVDANEGLETIPEAVYTMFVGGVTGDFIDCFLPSYASFRAVGLLWMLYLLLSQVLFKNLVMDTLISAYLKGGEEETKKTAQNLSNSMHSAFRLLSDGQSEVSQDDFFAFVKELNRSPRNKEIPDAVATMLFESFGTITEHNFVDVCFMLQNTFVITPKSSMVKKVFNLDDNENYQQLCSYVREPEDLPKFDVTMNNVLLVNLGMVILESAYDLMNWNQPMWMDYLEIMFSFVYLGEVIVKLSVNSWGSYWISASNRFDFATTWLLLLTSLLPFEADLAKYANVLRLLRLLRILKQLKQYPSVQFMVSTISRIITAAGEIFSLMGTFFFFFSSLSVNLFGGWLYEGNELLEGTEYAEKHWYPLNFNDMFMASAAWFVQVLCEFVPVYAEAIYKASPQWGSLAWWLFIFFYISTAAIMYELLLAFTVEVFMEVRAEMPEREEEKEEEAEKEEEEQEALEGTKRHEKGAGEEEEEDEFEMEAFFEGVQEDIAENEKVLHYRMLGEAALQEEVKEAYEEACGKKALPAAGSEPSDEEICKAAWQLENGIYNQVLSKFPEKIIDARSLHFRVLKATGCYNIAIIALIILTLVEVPPWCHGIHSIALWEWQEGDKSCFVKGGDLNLSGIPYLPPGYALVFEVIIEIAIMWKFMLEYQLETVHFEPLGVHYVSMVNIRLGFVFAVGSILDTAIFTVFGQPFRLTFIFRSGLLCLLPGVQRLAARIFNKSMMGEFLSVAVFYVGTVLFFAWIALTIFRSIDTISYYDEEGKPIMVNQGFTSLREAVYTMFVAGVTENFVDIFMPSLYAYRLSGLLWLAFLVLTQVLFLNLVIDAFVLAYLEGSEANQERLAKVQAVGTFEAFKLLSNDGAVPKQTFLKFLEELARSSRMTTVEAETAEVIFARLGRLTNMRFCDLCILLQNKIWVTPKNSVVKEKYPQLWEKPFFCEVRRMVWEEGDRPSFDDIMNWVLLVNLLVVFAESADAIGDRPVPGYLKTADMVFTFIYVGEVMVKLSVKSFAEYWSTAMNQFDFFTTFLLLFTTLIKYLPIAALQANLSRYANLLRLLRLLRVVKELKNWESVQFMVQTILRMVIAAGDILSLVGVVLFMFTTFSVNFFGGVLYDGHPKLAETAYQEKHWTVFNFNDHIMAFGTWFTQLLCEFAPEWAEALSLASDYGFVAWYIYPVFYLIGVAILFEILKAFTIETFLALKEESVEKEEEKKVNEEEREEQGKELDAEQRKQVDGMKKQAVVKDDTDLHCQFTKGPKFLLELRQAYVDYLMGAKEAGEE